MSLPPALSLTCQVEQEWDGRAGRWCRRSLRGEEFLLGFGKTARDGMHLAALPPSQTCDLVISNVLVLDPVLGMRKTSIGIRGGRVAAVGRAGNPDTLDGVDVVIGTGHRGRSAARD